MTEQRANEILRTKYPDAEIYKRNTFHGTSSTKISIYFGKGKIYDYSANSYADVLRKLGFNVLYKHEFDSYKQQMMELQKEIDDIRSGDYFDPFAGCFDDDDCKSDEDTIKDNQRQIDWIKDKLSSCYVE